MAVIRRSKAYYNFWSPEKIVSHKYDQEIEELFIMYF